MEELIKIKMLISYDGATFFGWQRQKSVPTIQEKIEQALTKIFSQEIKIFGSGRTDAGAHALGQVAHFVCSDQNKIPKDLCHSINSLCPPQIVIKQAWQVPQDFHALFSAVDKTYIYKIYLQERPCPFQKNRSFWINRKLDLDWLNQASELLLGKQDFASFQSQGTDVATTVREIYEAKWVPCIEKTEAIKESFQVSAVFFRLRGSGFLKHMVRNIVGTLLDLERNYSDLAKFKQIIKACDRQKALGTAPAQALYLDSVTYPRKLDNKCIKI